MGTTPRTPGAVAAVALATRRATAVVGLLLVLVIAALAALPAHPVHRTDGDEHTQQVWRADWSRRFPGCVAMLLWPHGETPRALVVRDARGRLAEVSTRQGLLRAGDPGSLAVGACR